MDIGVCLLRSSQKLAFTNLIHYSQGLICITKENFSFSLTCRNRLILTSTHKLIHKGHQYVTLQPLI